MKRKGYQISIALAAALFVTTVPAWAELPDESEETLCISCQMPITEGFCVNAAGHADGAAVVFEPAELSMDPDSMMPAYEIENGGQLAWFVREWQAGTLTTSDAFLADDISWEALLMSGINWTPIGTYVEGIADMPYNGVFNGNGYVISDLAFTDTEAGIPMTVFGNIGSSAAVKELGLEDIEVVSDASEISVLAWKNQGDILNCYINETTILANTEGAVVSDIAAENSETGTIKNSYSAVNVTPGMKADQTGTVTLSVHPVVGENHNAADPAAIENNYYVETEDPVISAMTVIPAEGSGIEGRTAAEFASGSVAWKLNDGQGEDIFGQTLAEYAEYPSFVRDESYTDPMTGLWIEEILNKPVRRVMLDYLELEDVYYFVNDTFSISNLPWDTLWQIMSESGVPEDVTADLKVLADTILNQKVPVCGHEATEVRDSIAASCTTSGLRETVCISCGEVLGTEEIPAGHVFGEYLDQGNASCLQDGTLAATCGVCGAVSEPIPNPGSMKPHQFTTYTYNNNASCLANGTETAYCDYGCGTTDTRAVENSQLSHSFTVYTYNNDASCMTDGTETAACDYGCQTTDTRTKEGSKLDHSFTSYIYNNDATCQADGTETALCDYNCQTTDTRTKEGSKTDHIFAEGTYVYNNDATCMNDGTETAPCTYGCGTQSEPRAAAGTKVDHVFETYIDDNDASCMANGHETAECKYGCQTTDTREKADSKLNHSFTSYIYNEDASCMANGTETAACDYGCQTTDTHEKADSKLDHSYTTYTYNNDATCQADGTETAACDYGCQTTDTRTKEESKLDHLFTVYTYNNDATCQADGTETAACDYGCQTTDTRAKEGSKTDHIFEEGTYVYNEDATCQADGTETASCAYGCGTQSEPRLVPGTKVDHMYVTYNYDNDATCQANGHETAVCEYGCQTTDTREKADSKLAHDFASYIYNEDATCQADGTETAVCGYGCEEIDTRTKEGSKLDHKFTAYTYNNDATCQADGTETAVCDYGCGTTDTRTKDDSTLDHKFTTYTYNNDATCQHNGSETAACDYGCGTTDTNEVQWTRKDHVFGEFVYNKNAGCKKNGTETAACIYNCGETVEKEAEGTMIPHQFDRYVYNEDATCQFRGTETAICAYGCETTDTRDIADDSRIVPHKYETYTYNNDATCSANGTETASCIYECGTTDTREKEGTKKDHTFVNGICTVCKTADETWIADSVTAIAEDDLSAGGWYGTSITLRAPEGCFINTQNTEDFGTAESITVELKNGANMVKYYLRKGNGKIVERSLSVKSDQTAPTGNVSVGSLVSAQAIPNVIFETYFGTAQIVRMQAQDAQSGMESIEYLIAKQAMSEEALSNAAWMVWNSASPVKLDQEGNYVVYAKLTDKAGNAAIINTNGFILDMTAPKIEGAANGSNVCPDTKLTITDANGTAVSLNGKEAVPEDGKITLSTAGVQTLKAADKAGNQISITFTVREDHVWDAGQIQEEETCSRVGFTLYTCTLCKVTKTEEVPMADHIFSHYVYNEDATCQADGTKTSLCDFGCNTMNTVTAEGTRTTHKFTNYVYNNDATCQKDGTKTALCDYECKTADTVAAEGTKTTHKFTNYVYNEDATCLTNGTKTALCDYGCSTIETIVAEGTMTGHKFSSYVYNNNATCTADGTKTAVCDYGCDATDTIAAEGTKLAHTFGTDHRCVICKVIDPATQTTAAPSNPNVPILGIEDFGGMWGILLISAGAVILIIVGVIFAAGRKRR